MPGCLAVSRAADRILLSFLALGAFGILIALGVWQLQRRDWKNGLIARFEAGLSKPPAAYDPAHPASEMSREFMRVRVDGEFLNAKTMKIFTPTPEAARAKTKEGFGYLLFTPLQFDGGIVFVNRGFVPQSLAATPAVAPEGKSAVTGIVRLPESPNWFTPSPEPAKNIFFDADIPAIAAAAQLAGSAITREYIQEEPVHSAQEWPLSRDPHELLASISNRHLEYALTWFGIAAALAGVSVTFIFGAWRERR